MKKWVCLIIGLILTVVVVYFWKRNNRDRPCTNCNILLIDIDILRADALPCYGYFRNTAPNICGLAKKSVLYKDNYANATWTLPSIFSTITSQYPTFHGVKTESINKLADNVPTLAEVLKKKGYKTIFLYEKDSSGIRQNFPNTENGGLRGFDEYVKGKTLETVISEEKGNKKPWFIFYYRDDLHLPYLLDNQDQLIDKTVLKPKDLPITATEYEDRLNIYLKKHYREVFKEKAINEYGKIILASQDIKPPRTVDILNKLTDLTNRNDYLLADWKPKFEAYLESFDKGNNDDKSYVRMVYDSKIKVVDDSLKKITSENSLKDSVVLLMSDHGEAFGEHGTFAHEYNYHTELFKTPLIIWSPKLKPRVVEEPTSNIDIFPTILDLVGIEKIDGLQGRSVVKPTGREYSLAEAGYGQTTGVVAQNKNWLYFRGLDGKEELYKKDSDPNENKNIVKENLGKTKEFRKLTETLFSYQKMGLKINNVLDTGLDKRKIEKLQKEGYF